MIPEVRACSTPSAPTSPTGHTERTPEPWLRCDHRLVGFDSALSVFALELDRPGRPIEVAGGLLRAEEPIQQATMIRLGRTHLALQALPQTSELLATRPSSLGGVD